MDVKNDEEKSRKPSIPDVWNVVQIMLTDRRLTLDDLCIFSPEVSQSTIHTLTEKYAQDRFRESLQKSTNGNAFTLLTNLFGAIQAKRTKFWIYIMGDETWAFH